jgi:hypothetical protein
MKNIPYRPVVNDFGQIINQITWSQPYVSIHANRKSRRKHLQKVRFTGNHKGVSFTHFGEHGQEKLRRYIQLDVKTGKKIFHYN